MSAGLHPQLHTAIAIAIQIGLVGSTLPLASDVCKNVVAVNWSLVNVGDYLRFDRKTFVRYRNLHLRRQGYPLRFRQKNERSAVGFSLLGLSLGRLLCLRHTFAQPAIIAIDKATIITACFMVTDSALRLHNKT